MIRALNCKINVKHRRPQIRMPKTFIKEDEINAPSSTSGMCKCGSFSIMMLGHGLRGKHMVVNNPLMHHSTMGILFAGLVGTNGLRGQGSHSSIGIHKEDARPLSISGRYFVKRSAPPTLSRFLIRHARHMSRNQKQLETIS